MSGIPGGAVEGGFYDPLLQTRGVPPVPLRRQGIPRLAPECRAFQSEPAHGAGKGTPPPQTDLDPAPAAAFRRINGPFVRIEREEHLFHGISVIMPNEYNIHNISISEIRAKGNLHFSPEACKLQPLRLIRRHFMELELCAPCLFGLEGPLKNELSHMGMSDVCAENGRVYFSGDETAVARANLRSRFGERILLVMGRFKAGTFDQLFENVRALPWEKYMPRDAAFPVKGWSLESALHSGPDCQKGVKKALAERMKDVYGYSWCPEDGETYPVQFSLMKDNAVLYLDTSGTGLHKRGYRPAQVAAPLRETLAAAVVDMAGYRGKGEFLDPFCGSGTLAIEAAFAALGRAPGLNRPFLAERWKCLPQEIWAREREEARSREYRGEYRIAASDIDPAAVAKARENARRAGVEDRISFSVADARELGRNGTRGVLCANPPYGERLLEKREAEELMRSFGAAMGRLSGWDVHILSSMESLENLYGRKADKRRRLYNGMIPCQLFSFLSRRKNEM